MHVDAATPETFGRTEATSPSHPVVAEGQDDRTRAILDSAHDAFVSVDSQLRVTGWNKAAKEMFGWGREEILGRDLLETLIPADQREHHLEQLALHLDTRGVGEARGMLQLTGLARNGSRFPIELSAWKVIDDTGASCHAFIRDISSRIETEAALRMGREVAERANRAKSEFLSRMSHELRTPLNAILGFGQLLETEELTSDQAENVGEVIKAGKHLLQVMNEILDISRIETGRLALSVEPVPLGLVVGEALSLVRPLAAERQITVGLEGVVDESLHVRADQQRLKQILLNLLSNGIKYNQVGGAVTVAVTDEDGDVRLEVRDTGPGISLHDLGRVFSPFDRLGAETSDVEGTGLGLAISKRLAEGMGGRLSVTSTEGFGSTFLVQLPRAQPVDDPHWTVSEAAAGELPGSSYEVLYVEDNTSNTLLVERILKDWPAVQLITTTDGAQALSIAAKCRPDLVLLDLNLPDMCGQTVLERLQDDVRTADLPVLIVSADATRGQMRRLLNAGARGYLTKPLDVAEFRRVVGDLLQDPREVAMTETL